MIVDNRQITRVDETINPYSTEEKYDDKYRRLFSKVLSCQLGFQRQDLDEIIEIVKTDFPPPNNRDYRYGVR